MARFLVNEKSGQDQWLTIFEDSLTRRQSKEIDALQEEWRRELGKAAPAVSGESLSELLLFAREAVLSALTSKSDETATTRITIEYHALEREIRISLQDPATGQRGLLITSRLPPG
jgi:hypothetical protein